MSSKKIYVICPFPKGVAAGQRLKYEQYFDQWVENGFQVKVSSYMSMFMWKVAYSKGNYFLKILGIFIGHIRRIRDLFFIHNYDIVYVFMWVTPFGTTFFERLIRIFSKKLIYDIEDNVLTTRSSELNRITKLLKNQKKNKFLIESADHVITSSPVLNNHCVEINKNKQCTYISSSVNTSTFSPSNLYQNNTKIVIGWTGTFSSKKYLDSLRSVLIELNKKCDFKLRVIGNFEYSFPEIDLEVIQWSIKNEVKDMQGIDIGIYPLVKDQWVLGKSGLKAIQYMSFGLPTVATNIGTSLDIIQHLKNGWLVSNNSEWVEALTELIQNPLLRERLGKQARKTVVDNYSTSVIGEKYLSIINKI
ncbi:glycosyltransferase [bacterium]|jgi:L-malate glycosyltransferase|nr:glycosyltransferase [bacterium]